MQIESITLSNFRCFGATPQKIYLNDVTAFIGANGSGKTAVLHALGRMFGASQSERSLAPDDFHIAGDHKRSDFAIGEELSLSIDVTFRFPELQTGTDLSAVGECFNQMKVIQEGDKPYCRARLEGRWIADGTEDGTTEQKLFWVRSEADTPDEKDKFTFAGHDRALVQVHYVPATRDPVKQIRFATGSIVNRLFRALKWSDDTRNTITTAATQASDAFRNQEGVDSIHHAIGKYWDILRSGDTFRQIDIQPIGSQLEDLLRQLQAVFSPAPGGDKVHTERLSDGLKSLFYLSLLFSVFEIESRVQEGNADYTAFDADLINAPVLTIFAVEEPENHVSPHYLGRILKAIRMLTDPGRAQSLITSHSPSVMRRIAPDEVRHVHLDEVSGTSQIRPLSLPSDQSEAFKYITEAIRSHPEIYFSKAVVLGEGASEEIVIPRLAEALGYEFDQSFVSMVPLGGRHVNHFWRLLNDLEIPHVTLLDLDRERETGGWSRVKYVLNQLLAVGIPKENLFLLHDGNRLTDQQYEGMDSWALDPILDTWTISLEQYGVFFSSPLDLDFMLLQKFTEIYKATCGTGRGPRIPDDASEKYEKAQRAAIRSVLKKEGGDGTTYTTEEQKLFFWYRYLFLGRSKAATHFQAMASMQDAELAKDCPEVLKRLCGHVNTKLGLDCNAGDDA